MDSILDNLPVATIVFLAGLVALIVAYIGDDIAFTELWEKLLFLGGGTAGIGYVRNQAGKGVRKG
jgi:hypothetical protein